MKLGKNKVLPLRPDLDNGKLYQRFFVNQNHLKNYLQYKDEAGNKMLEDALLLANKVYPFSLSLEEVFV